MSAKLGISDGRKSCGQHATGPTSDQALIQTENIIPLNIKLNLVPLIKLSIGLVDVNFFGEEVYSNKCDSFVIVYIR